MIRRVLIANRGEIAVRIIRTCREMGIETVTVYSTVDKDSLHVRLADKAVCIGPPEAPQSYLAGKNLVMAAVNTACEAIHPGIGFLSEDAGFARMVRERGLIFIGPDPEVLEHTGNRFRVRKTAGDFGLPLIPGSGEIAADLRPVKKAATELGFPAIIKAGGRGSWVVRSAREIERTLPGIKREAALFGAAPGFLVEQYLDNPQQVDLQVIADGAGKVAVLGERDGSIQKSHHTLIDESPSPGVSRPLRRAMSEKAAKLFRGLKYRGVGTVTFLIQGEKYYFLGVKPRLQTGHPVTELVTGADILRQQFLTCVEGRMEMPPSALRMLGWAMECRINALSPGTVTKLEVPGGLGVRFDSCLYEGCSVNSHYDSLVGKVIAYGPNRDRTLARMDRALKELAIEGINTDKSRQQGIIRAEVFRSGNIGTRSYDKITKP
ncbi:ATP-grasp domain-containing protein [Treponema sp. TIM-1]|uniref:biotin carboxylase N-terminal domain-containing protein n=1 Tax=Treponema sp. TIM-1 TaxID=2898417 RepID=UPI0039815F94